MQKHNNVIEDILKMKKITVSNVRLEDVQNVHQRIYVQCVRNSVQLNYKDKFVNVNEIK